jgi:hypothetical protein
VTVAIRCGRRGADRTGGADGIAQSGAQSQSSSVAADIVSPSLFSNARSIERLIEVYQRGLTISSEIGVSFEHVFEIVIESR